MSRAHVAITLTIFTAGCARAALGDDAGDVPDADATADAGLDSGPPALDAAPELDAPMPPDLGEDLAVPEDSGPGVDFGFRLDGGLRDADVPVDAGAFDAATGDAGGGDASVPDAGHDASTGDAGGTDAGRPDAGTPDAGALDAGSGDAGSFDDAATDDAAVPDAGPPLPGCAVGVDDVVTGTILLTTDNFSTIYVNGVLVDGTRYDWRSPQTHVVSLYRHPSHVNVVAIDSLNQSTIDGRDRGVIVDARAIVGGTERVLVSDATWLFSASLVSGWSDVAFDASSWAPAVDEGANGISPWGAILGTSTAHWLWAYDSNLPAGAKTGADEHVYFRREFYFDDAGAISDTPGVCP